MATVRCYVPLTPDQLVSLGADRHLAGPHEAYAVTTALRSDLSSGDDDEWEYAALQQAASSQLGAGGPVVVAAVDLTSDRVELEAGGDTSAQIRAGDIDLPRVAALHVGDDVVTGEVSALPDPGSHLELSWYDTTELDHVVELVRALDTSD